MNLRRLFLTRVATTLLVWGLVLVAFPSHGRTQIIPLDAAALERLRTLIAADPAARAWWQDVREQAETALAREPAPLDLIRFEGRLESDPARQRTRAALADMEHLAALVEAWRVTEDDRYAAKAGQYILAWLSVLQPEGNPINENKLEPLLGAYRLLKPHLRPEDRRQIDTWIAAMAAAQRRSGEQHRGTGMALGNWQTKRIKLLAHAAILLEDAAMMTQVRQLLQEYLDENLRPDGTSFDYEYRDALHYHVSGLVPLLELGILLGSTGIDVYRMTGDSGGSVRRSLEFMRPYLTGQKVHPEWVNSRAPFDRARAEAGDPEFVVGRPYDPRHALPMLELAAWFDRTWGELAAALRGPDQPRFASWRSVLLAAARAPEQDRGAAAPACTSLTHPAL